MIEVQAEARKPVKFKRFKRKAAEPIINDDNPFANNKPEIKPTAPQLSFVEKLTVLIESSSIPMTQKDTLNGTVKQFQGPEIISWREDQGRFGLAEKVLKQNDLEFIAMRQRMQVMGDADGCGGVNETGGSIGTGLVTDSKVVDLLSGKASKILGNQEQKHAPGSHKHCDHGSDFGSCEHGCQAA